MCRRPIALRRLPAAAAALAAGLAWTSPAWPQVVIAEVAPGASPDRSRGLAPDRLSATVEKAKALPALRAILVARDGAPVVEQTFKGASLEVPVNVKSVSKTIVSALVGAALDRKILAGVEQPIAPLLKQNLPGRPDERLKAVTIDDLLTMRSGLERTSGANYGRWVSSPNWVRFALAQPFVDEPGGRMLYSTGNSHLLSALLTQGSQRSLLALARDWLGEPLGIVIPPWTRDPQGLYLGGNNMALSPRALLRFGEM